MSKLRELAEACHNGACNPHGIINALPDAMKEIPFGRARESVELKIILGQLSFLVGESLGPSMEALQEFELLLHVGSEDV